MTVEDGLIGTQAPDIEMGEFSLNIINRPQIIAQLELAFRLAGDPQERVRHRANHLRYFFKDPSLTKEGANEIARQEQMAWDTLKKPGNNEAERRQHLLASNVLINSLTRWKFNPEEATNLEMLLLQDDLSRQERVEAHAKLHALDFALPKIYLPELKETSHHYYRAIEHLRSMYRKAERVVKKHPTLSNMKVVGAFLWITHLKPFVEAAEEEFCTFYQGLNDIQAQVYPEFQNTK